MYSAEHDILVLETSFGSLTMVNLAPAAETTLRLSVPTENDGCIAGNYFVYVSTFGTLCRISLINFNDWKCTAREPSAENGQAQIIPIGEEISTNIIYQAESDTLLANGYVKSGFLASMEAV